MSEVAHAKPPAPILTRVMQVLGLGAIAWGGAVILDVRDCEELGCLAGPIGIAAVVWGIVAVLSGLRGPIGLVFLVGALVLTFIVSWVKFLIGVVALVVLMGLTRMSKDRLAPYYRRGPTETG